MNMGFNQKHRPVLGYSPMSPDRPGTTHDIFWCQDCRKLFEGKNPIECDACGNDVTLAPDSVRSL